MHILVFGGTGQIGVEFVKQALEAGHRLTLYARTPSKLPHEVANHPNVTIIEGDFNNMPVVRKTLIEGPEVLVSVVGPSAVWNKGTAISEFYEQLFPLLPTSSSIKRCFVLSTASYKVPEDKSSFKWFLGVKAIQTMGGSAYHEIMAMSEAVASLPLDKVEWTLFRIPGLTNAEAKPVTAGYIGDGKSDGLTISRKSVAAWILQELHERNWVGKAPVLSNHGLL